MSRNGKLLLCEYSIFKMTMGITTLVHDYSASHTTHSFQYRGESFRQEFSRFGDVRSLIPETVHIMALTVTAIKSTRHDKIKIMGMIQPTTVFISPNRENITYSVYISKSWDPRRNICWARGENINRTTTNRTIIFCRTYDQCSHIYI